MRIFDVSDCKAEIVRPKMNLTAWSAQNKPFGICNASLYDRSTRVPIGTIIENGVFVHNDGNGFGCGVTWTDSRLQFGQPWDRSWRDYLTGYNSPVQKGVYVDPVFTDTYVFNCSLSRIGIGEKQNKTFIVTDDGVTLREFANNAISAGFDILVNLDGGGSRHLYYDGKMVYQSSRVPYNAIAFFKDGSDEKPQPTAQEKCTYPEPTRNLFIWCRGNDVKWLQWHLNKLNFRCGTIDGIFGWNTWNAVVAFQKTWSKVPDGICGPNTRRELLKWK